MTTGQLLLSPLFMVYTPLTRLIGGTNPPSSTLKWADTVKTYNWLMGGIGLLDSFTAKYKVHISSTRWYLYIFWHTIILRVVNAWLQLKRDCRTLQIPEKEVMNRKHFQAQLATFIIQINTQRQTIHGWGKSTKPLHVFAGIMWGTYQWKLKKEASAGTARMDIHQLHVSSVMFVCASQI